MARPKPKRPFWSATYRALADEKGISIQAVAEHFDMEPAGVRHWFNGHRKITLDQFLELCSFTGLDPVMVLYPGYIPQEFRERVEGLAKDVLAARPADKPSYRGTAASLKRKKVTTP